MTSEPLKPLLQDRQFWLNFINEYKALPVLWLETHPQFSSKKSRDLALLSLTKIVTPRWPGANVEFIKQRISNFRRTFLNEYEKVKEAKNSKKIYTPSLYYYNHLMFLKEGDVFEKDTLENGNKVTQKVSEKRFATSSLESTKINDKRRQSTDECTDSDAELPNEPAPGQKRLKLIACKNEDADASIILNDINYSVVEDDGEEEFLDIELKHDVIEVLNDDFSTDLSEAQTQAFVPKLKDEQDDIIVTEDEFDDVAKRVATHFRKMEPEQCLLAEKLIFDICISGRLKRLSANTSLSFS